MSKVIPVLLVILGFGLGFVVFRGAAGQAGVGPEAAVGSGFAYQGLLQIAGKAADGPYDFQFKLFDAATGGNQVGSTVSVDDVAVADGLFSVQLDFGAGAFAGEARWLELAVREGSSTGAYSTLAGRQRLSPTPYALHAAEAGSVAWGGLRDVPAGFADGVDDVGLSAVTWTDVQNRPAGLDDGDDDTTYTAGTGLALAGTQFSAEGSPYDNVLVVAQSGGDFSSVQAALDSITGAGAENPYLVYVAPGVYSETVTLKPYVTVEGAGEGTTIIRGTGGSEAPWLGSGSATLMGADNAALRHVTVESDGTGQDYAVAILNDNASPSLSQVTASAEGGRLRNYGVTNASSSSVMSNVTASATGGTHSYGVSNSSSSPTMSNVTATAANGIINFGVSNASSSSVMSNVTASAAGGSNNYGVTNSSSSPTMSDMTASAGGGTVNYGVFNINNSRPSMINVTASGSGGGTNYGVLNDNSSPTMSNVTARAEGGSNDNYGVYNDASSPTIRHSVLEGSTLSVNRLGATVKVANSQLIGSISSGLTCFNNYDANLNAITCP